MGLPITLSEIAPRISAGAFILNSGLGKRGADEEAAAGMHGFAAGTYPFLGNVPPQQFAKALSTAEIAIGAALLTPFVPTAVAGAALTAFSGGLLGLYLKTPGMRKEGSLAPTEQGLSIAKDSWLLGIGIGLLVRGTVDRQERRVRRAGKVLDRASKRAVKARKRLDR
ncbi:hypothetical protein E9549_11725 [Blastococcus sp. MG754426]|uniref:hypothetical protein n=1 Tax=unclassified Blastococcus TaxID=2619396 RepID=UPI001EEF9D0F|nr:MULTISPECIES: hypothetical protein [unclassified Blastococcus]MCF6508069.1 hypothetical protein [Blastococcus sp. MG754426]MCF6511603.1 hypothetical protein [Blastococcus sp. MG754427]MCF6733766.1 hypothetical protein [Blastococcus sp. KM273129]